MYPLASLSEYLETPTVAILLVVLVALVAQILWSLQRLAKHLEAPGGSRQEEALERLEQHLASIRDSQGKSLDLRRIEHLLVDIRDGSRRMEER
ncbi:MAG: hypothetical protein KDB61_16275, partial [Planctomycetes bacterium]|nr:hypothetical protein [Planctomycetota bacterium]